MIVAEAIAIKHSLEGTNHFITRFNAYHAQVKSKIDNENMQIESKALDLAKQTLGKTNVTLKDDDVIKTMKPFLDANVYTLVDPLEIEKKMKKIKDDHLNFILEIDATLSESNATTKLVVD